MDLLDLNIAVVGLGLMGGSLAMALRGAVGKLIGVDRDPKTRRIAMSRGVVDSVAARLDEVIAIADLVVLAVPVRSIVSLVHSLPHIRSDGCMVLDLGSTKGEIGQAMNLLPSQFSAIGGHPMCGREHSGIDAAAAELYRNQTFILCRNLRTTPRVEGIAVELVHAIGSQSLFMTPDLHDQLVATSSHLPYIVASILMRQAWNMAEEDDRLWPVSASGLRDTTRLAGSDAQMMLEILLSNRKQILRQIEAYGQELAHLAEQLRSGDEEALWQTLDAAKRQRLEYLKSRYDHDNAEGH